MRNFGSSLTGTVVFDIGTREATEVQKCWADQSDMPGYGHIVSMTVTRRSLAVVFEVSPFKDFIEYRQG